MKKLLLIILLFSYLGAAFAQVHVQWRGENRDGKYPDSGLLDAWPEDGPKLLWYAEGIGDGHASAAVTADRVYTAGMPEDKGCVFAFDHNGKLTVWTATQTLSTCHRELAVGLGMSMLDVRVIPLWMAYT